MLWILNERQPTKSGLGEKNNENRL